MRARREIAAVAAVAGEADVPGVPSPELPPPPVPPREPEPELPTAVDDEDEDDGRQFATRDEEEDGGFQISSSPPTMAVHTACTRISCEAAAAEEGGGGEEELDDRVSLVPVDMHEMRLAGCRGYRAVPANWNSRNNVSPLSLSLSLLLSRLDSTRLDSACLVRNSHKPAPIDQIVHGHRRALEHVELHHQHRSGPLHGTPQRRHPTA